MIMAVLLIIIIAVVICSRYVAYGKVQIKDFWVPLSFFVIAAVLVILMMNLRHSTENCKVNITIDNKYSISEIQVEGGDIYYLSENKEIEINNLPPDGSLVIKTMNGAKLIEFVDSQHLFSFDHHFTVMINNNDIEIENNSPLLIETSDISTEEFYGQILEKEYQDTVKPFWNAVVNNDKETIMNLIHYPLKRQYPIPGISNKSEMIERYDTIFDEILLNIIKKSSIETDWSDVGWRGIMLENGIIWVDYDGKIIAINYQSPHEIVLRDNIILELKNNLHTSLRDFIQPILFCETENYKMRVDLLNSNYRLALWSKEKEQSDIPNMVILDGERIPHGSGGNQLFVFNDTSQYIISIDILTAFDYGNFSIYNDVNNSWLDNMEKRHPLINENIIKIEM